jgi:preprotein translocase subunit SecA
VPKLIRQAKEDSDGDFWVDEKQKQVHLSEAGMLHAEELLREAGIISEDDSLYSGQNLIRRTSHECRLCARMLYISAMSITSFAMAK